MRSWWYFRRYRKGYLRGFTKGYAQAVKDMKNVG